MPTTVSTNAAGDRTPVRPLAWAWDALEAVARWPADRRLMLLCSARPHRRWAHWSMLAAPRATLTVDADGARIAGEPPDGRSWPALPPDPLGALRAALDATARPAGGRATAFAGGWIGMLGYELGARLEPAAGGGRCARDDRGWPLLELAWCPDALVYDGRRRRWWAIGDPPDLGAAPRAAVLDASRARMAAFDPASMASSLPRADYEAAAARVIEYIGAGDVFQANLTQRLTGAWRGEARALALRGLRASGAWYGAYLELGDDRRVLSLSPELFLSLDARRREVITRPIKGTRPGDGDRRELDRSAKDAAELHMIVDLMRNDLGRVCVYGSIDVPGGRRIERHPTVLHGVAEVRGVLRDDVDAADLVGATFPAGSITGAPKIRAMQIIDELEPVRRGPYCGAVGLFGDDGRVVLNVAIRTLALQRESAAEAVDAGAWTVDYGVGAGIVADSDPSHEYDECLVKAEILRAL